MRQAASHQDRFARVQCTHPKPPVLPVDRPNTPGHHPHPQLSPSQHRPASGRTEPSAPQLGHHCSIASIMITSRSISSSQQGAYQVVRPCFSALTSPARARCPRCRLTTERSTLEHSEISLTLHGLPHLIRQVSSFTLVGSPSDLKNTGSSTASRAERLRAAALGLDAKGLGGCAMMQV